MNSKPAHTEQFPVEQVTLVGPTQVVYDEQLGSKRKFWLYRVISAQPLLFKYARLGTGEHWAEKLGSEIAGVLGIPAAPVRLAEENGRPGVLVESIVPHSWDDELFKPLPLGELIHGNEILSGFVPAYDRTKLRGQKDHTYSNVLESLRRAVPDEKYASVMTQFAGLLVLDALIGNTDRHHENWALLRSFRRDPASLSLAPSYDHASSFGRELTDQSRNRFLEAGTVAEYIKRGRGAIFGLSQDKHADNPIELVRWASELNPEWFAQHIARVQQVQFADIMAVVNRIPDGVWSSAAAAFCSEFIRISLENLKRIWM